MAAKHGTRRRYIDGCRCDDCRMANRLYMREYEQKRKARTAPVVALSSTPVSGAVSSGGRVESAVEAELEGLSQAESRPGLKEAALALARVLDTPSAVNQHASASKELRATLDALHKGADVRRSRLAAVRSMTRSGAATG